MKTSPHASGQGSGKLILFGEHAVVWGASALATSLPAGAQAHISRRSDGRPTSLTLEHAHSTLAHISPDPEGGPLEQALAALLSHFPDDHSLDIHVELHVPPGAGLGSSAALATSIARALCALHERDQSCVALAVAQSEGIFHSSASGIDQAAAAGLGLIRFDRGNPPTSEPLREIPGFSIAICQAAPGASTAIMVEGVAARRQRAPRRYTQLAEMITAIVDDAIEAMRQADLPRLGELIDFNHGLLCAMGVSSEPLDRACHIARQAGALGAKLTGAGGGGCVYALASDAAHARALVDAWKIYGLEAFDTTVCSAALPHPE